MIYDRYLGFFHQPRLLRGVFGIVFFSFVMCWLEVIYHREILLVQSNSAILNRVRQLATEEQANSVVFQVAKVLSGETPASAMKALEQTEREKVEKLNTYAYLSVMVPWVIVIFILQFVYRRLEQAKKSKHELTVFGAEFRSIFPTTFIAVCLYGVTQAYFYEYAVSYGYASESETNFQIQKFLAGKLNC